MLRIQDKPQTGFHNNNDIAFFRAIQQGIGCEHTSIKSHITLSGNHILRPHYVPVLSPPHVTIEDEPQVAPPHSMMVCKVQSGIASPDRNSSEGLTDRRPCINSQQCITIQSTPEE